MFTNFAFLKWEKSHGYILPKDLAMESPPMTGQILENATGIKRKSTNKYNFGTDFTSPTKPGF